MTAKAKYHKCRRCGIAVWEPKSLCNDCFIVVGKDEASNVWLWDRAVTA